MDHFRIMRAFWFFFMALVAPVAATQDWFEIEIIIFEHLGVEKHRGTAETWPHDLSLFWPDPLVELEPAVDREEQPEIIPPFEELPSAVRRMNGDAYALRNQSAYRLLWHKAWRAPLLPEATAPWILVQAGDQFGEHFRLEGAVRVHLSRYLHLHTNLWLTDMRGDQMENDLYVPAEEEPAIRGSSIVSPSGFDWSQLPKPHIWRWGCNFVREHWPEDDRLRPADYHEDPAPANWYYPFGCPIPSESIDQDMPLSVALPPRSADRRGGLHLRYPELIGINDQEAGASEPESVPDPDQAHRQDIGGRSVDAERMGGIAETQIEDPDFEIPAWVYPEKTRYDIDTITHIQNRRRMRSREHHYVDHPRIGILALIHPLEKPELIPEEADPAADSSAEPGADPGS